MVQNIIKSKSITQIVTPKEQIKWRDIVIEILMTGIARKELHTTQKGINLTMDITIEIKINDRAPKADSHDRYYRDRYAIDRLPFRTPDQFKV